jgi:hypothetical protein
VARFRDQERPPGACRARLQGQHFQQLNMGIRR